jgi:hypothetical protein
VEEDAAKGFGNLTFQVSDVEETKKLDNRNRDIAKPKIST